MSVLSNIANRELIWLFRWTSDEEFTTTPKQDDKLDAALPGIRCPLCKWRPLRSSRWTCWDCGHPENFFSGCGTEWNTFETKGLCPTCSHQWIWTACLRCTGWSHHEAWYESEAE